jgi:hypothetical protein
MGDLTTGMLVRHASLGVGKVIAVEATAVHVFFPQSDQRYAAKLHLPTAKALLATGDVAPDAWLQGLSSFTLDSETRRYALAANWITHDQAIADFLETYPKGFADPAHVGNGTGKRERASRWRAASAEWAQALGQDDRERLLAAGDVRELTKRALRIERHVTLVAGTFEPGALKDALQDPDSAGAFFEALIGLLSVPSPGRARFEKLFAATDALGIEPALAWPIATLFPFVADPTRHVFLWPRTACGAAERLGCDLRFEPSPSWVTYAKLRTFSTQLLEKLEPSGARDFVDVEAFLYATATARPSAAKARAASRPKATAGRRATRKSASR